MYPALNYLIEDLTGYYIPLPVATFGLMVAISFYIGGAFFKNEIKRKAQLNLIHAYRNRKGVDLMLHTLLSEMILPAVLWGITGEHKNRPEIHCWKYEYKAS